MQDYDLDAYLGAFAEELDADRRWVLGQVLDKLAERWPSPDFTDEATAAGNAATELAFGDSTADQIVIEYRDAREAERTAHLRLTGALLYTSLSEPAVSEVALAERFGVTRMTVRKALGK